MHASKKQTSNPNQRRTHLLIISLAYEHFIYLSYLSYCPRPTTLDLCRFTSGTNIMHHCKRNKVHS